MDVDPDLIRALQIVDDEETDDEEEGNEEEAQGGEDQGGEDEEEPSGGDGQSGENEERHGHERESDHEERDVHQEGQDSEGTLSGSRDKEPGRSKETAIGLEDEDEGGDPKTVESGVNEEGTETLRPTKRARRVVLDSPFDQNDSPVGQAQASTAVPLQTVAPEVPRQISVWKDEALNSDEHLDRIDELVFQEADRDFLLGHNLPSLYNHALRASLRVASLIRFTQNDVMVQLNESQENEQQLTTRLKKAENDLTESQKVVQDLTDGVGELNREKATLNQKLEAVAKVKSLCEDKLASTEADLTRTQELLLQRDDKVKELDAELGVLKAAEVKLLEESTTLKVEKSDLQKTLADRDLKVAGLEEEVKQLKTSLAKINKAAFTNAVTQLQVVNPGIDVKPVHYRKCVSGGKIGSIKDNIFVPSFPLEEGS